MARGGKTFATPSSATRNRRVRGWQRRLKRKRDAGWLVVVGPRFRLEKGEIDESAGS